MLRQDMSMQLFACLFSVNNQCHQTGRCPLHSRYVMHYSRPRYYGIDIPIEVVRPIRAGVLFGVDRNKLCELVVKLLVIRDGDEPFPVETQEFRAGIYIDTISGFSNAELIDNCFWGDGVHHRGMRVAYQWYPKSKSKKVRIHSSVFLKCLLFLSEFNVLFSFTGLSGAPTSVTAPSVSDHMVIRSSVEDPIATVIVPSTE